MNKDLVDEEVEKALELRMPYDRLCEEAYDTINRLKKEIKRLKKSNRNWRRKVQRLRNNSQKQNGKVDFNTLYKLWNETSGKNCPLSFAEAVLSKEYGM